MVFLDIVKAVFREFYSSLFFYIFLSFIWFLLSTPIIFLGLNSLLGGVNLLFLLPALLLGPIFLSGLKTVSCRTGEKGARLRQIFTELPGSFISGLVGIIYAGIFYAVFYVAFNFYLVRAENNFFMMVLAVLVLYFALVFTISQMYFWGLSALRPELSFWEKVKYSFLLFIDNLIQSFLWLMGLLGIVALLLIITPGLPVLFFSLTSLLIIVGTRKLSDPYSF